MKTRKLPTVPRSPFEVSLLHLPHPWCVDIFVQNVSHHRGRPIRIACEDLGDSGELSGAWLAFNNFDLIVCDHTAGQGRRDAIILHEIGHILFGYESPRNLRGNIPMMCRNNYSDSIEWEAEEYATNMMCFIKFSGATVFDGRIS